MKILSTKIIFLFTALLGIVSLAEPAPAAAPTAAPGPLGGLVYSPSTLRTTADLSKEIPEAVVRADLEAISTVTDRVRIYSLEHGFERVVPVAKSLGLTVSLSLALGADSKLNETEIARGVALALHNRPTVNRIFVGNELLITHRLGVEALLGYMARVKAAVAGTDIAVGTGEPWSIWLEEPKLGAASDFIGAHIYPYWDGVPLEAAQGYIGDRYRQLQSAYPGKAVVIAETGWPDAGVQRGGAVPSRELQTRFVQDFVRTARAAHYDFYICEAFDQPWKAGGEGEVGAHWGIFDAGRRLKFPLP